LALSASESSTRSDIAAAKQALDDAVLAEARERAARDEQVLAETQRVAVRPSPLFILNFMHWCLRRPRRLLPVMRCLRHLRI
jgi:hypothetical protein